MPTCPPVYDMAQWFFLGCEDKNIKMYLPDPGPVLLKKFHVKSMLINKDFQTWHLIGWQHSRRSIRSQVRKSLLTNMEFNMDFNL